MSKVSRPRLAAHCAVWCFFVGVGSLAQAETAIDPGWTLPPEQGGVRRWVVTGDVAQGLAAADDQADHVAEFAPGTVLSNLGCAPLDQPLWCKVKPMQQRAHVYVRKSSLDPATGPDGVVALGKDDSRQRVRKRDYDATGKLPCAQEQGQALGTCKSAVARSGGGDATVVATFSNGFQRMLYFELGAFVRASSTMSGVGTDIDWSLADGTYTIRVDDQRFVVDSAFVLGGEGS